MTPIPKTRIATSDPINLCKGFALFPQIGTVRAGVSGGANSGALFNTNDTLLTWRLGANAGYEITIGICGPAYAARLDMEGKAENGAVELTISNDEIAAGFFIGCAIRLYLNITIDELETTVVWDWWNTHLEQKWQRLATLRPEVRVDMIDLIMTVIRLVLDESGQKNTLIQKVNNISPALLGTWGMFDDRANQFAANQGKMVARPTFNIPIDIVPMIPELNAVNTGLKAFFSRFSAGPQIGVQIPVSVEMSKVKLDSTEYTGLSFGSGKVTGRTTAADPSNPGQLKVELKHTPGFDLTLGIFANLNICKLWNINTTMSLPILTLLGISPKLGTYSNELSNTIGQMFISSFTGSEKDTGLVEVIFEEPEVFTA